MLQHGQSSRTPSQEAHSDDTAKGEGDGAASQPKEASFMKGLRGRLGVDFGLIVTMFKSNMSYPQRNLLRMLRVCRGALPPTISIAVYINTQIIF